MDILKSPKQILMEQTTLSPEMMQAEMMANGQTPPKFRDGGHATTMTLNIGKNIGGEKNSLSDEQIIRALEDRGHKIKNIKTIPAQPNLPFGPFEDTAVVTTKSNLKYPKEFLDNLSHTLGQEAIPAHLHEQNTAIMGGPKAEAWGPFNPDYFTHQTQSTPQGNPQPNFLKRAAQQIGQTLTPSYETQQALKKYIAKPASVANKAVNYGLLGASGYSILNNLLHNEYLPAAKDAGELALYAKTPIPGNIAYALGSEMTDRATKYMQQHPEFREQVSNVSSSPMGGALSGDTGLAAEILKNAKE